MQATFVQHSCCLSFNIHPIKTTCDDRSDSGIMCHWIKVSLRDPACLEASSLVVGVHNGSDSDGCDSKGSNGCCCLIGKGSEPGQAVMAAEAEMAARRMQWQLHEKHGRRR